MALEPPHPETTPELPGAGLLERAARAARDERPEGWVALSESIMTRVRATVMPAHPVLVRTDPDGSRTYLSTRVLSAGLRELLQREPTHAPDGIRFHLDDDRLVGVDLALVVAYGVDVAALASRVRQDVVAELVELVGTTSMSSADVAIDVVDVVVGDPRVV